MNMRTFLLLSNIGRIPGILVSTYAADGLIDGRFAESAVLFAVAAVIAVLGIVFQKRIMKFLEKAQRAPATSYGATGARFRNFRQRKP